MTALSKVQRPGALSRQQACPGACLGPTFEASEFPCARCYAAPSRFRLVRRSLIDARYELAVSDSYARRLYGDTGATAVKQANMLSSAGLRHLRRSIGFSI